MAFKFNSMYSSGVLALVKFSICCFSYSFCCSVSCFLNLLSLISIIILPPYLKLLSWLTTLTVKQAGFLARQNPGNETEGISLVFNPVFCNKKKLLININLIFFLKTCNTHIVILSMVGMA
uniref:Uncharacterized protein n=1 Tax=uncultured marine virus TaxID=186617 RepID=A0A0F7L638_9VIRU|nr:hypothetical protein [uncultured marine virus]